VVDFKKSINSMEDFVNDDAQWEEEESYVWYFSEKKESYSRINFFVEEERFVAAVKKEIGKDLEQMGKKMKGCVRVDREKRIF
jgi:hypothetical protein